MVGYEDRSVHVHVSAHRRGHEEIGYAHLTNMRNHIIQSLHSFRNIGFPHNLSEKRTRRVVQERNEGVEASSVGHANDNLLHAQLRGTDKRSL